MNESFLSERVKSLIHLDPMSSSCSSPLYNISKTTLSISKIRNDDPLVGIYPFCLDAHALIKDNGSLIRSEGFQWLLYPLQWKNLLSELNEEEEVDVREPLLWMTMDFERSLGNILYSLKIQVPHLLKDILKNDTLLETIGAVNGEILVSLMGSPETLNIRNLLWHGFVSMNELHSAYVSALIVVAQSIGHFLVNKGLKLRRRNFSSNLERCSHFPSHLMTNNPNNVGSHSDLTVQRVFTLLEEGKDDLSLMVFLPYLESNLRLIYTRVNDCPTRLLTAESDQFYTTFEEIFSPEITTANGSIEVNRMREQIGDSLLEFYYDIFILPDGPRVRDRLSHGEFQMFDVPGRFSRPLNLLLRSLLSPSDFDSYRSIFHPFSLLFHKVSQAIDEVLKSGNVYLQKGIPSNIIEYSCLFRPKHEIELVKILNQIADAIKTSAISMNENRSITLDKMQSKSLRSRQRATAERMLSGIETLQILQMETLCYILLVFDSRENIDFNLKNLRKILSLHLNIRTWVRVDENRWDRVESASGDLKKLMATSMCI